MDPTDRELVARAQAGDGEAFVRLVERHRTTVMRLARQLGQGAEEAQDLAQETFVAAFQHLARLRDGSKFGPWLRQIAVNLARQRWRHERQISLEPLWEDSGAVREAEMRSGEAARCRMRAWVREAIAALAPEPRSAVLLHYFDGYDYEETAALLQVPVSTVRGRLHTARRRLREEMAELALEKSKSKHPPVERQEFELTADDLAALRGAERIASRDSERPALQTLCIEPDGTVLATDTHRLFVQRGTSLRPTARALVRSSLLAGLRHRPGLRTAGLSLSTSEATLSLTDERDSPAERVERAPLVTKENFPDYDRVIPTDWKIRAFVPVGDLLAALTEVARFEAFLNSAALPDEDRCGEKLVLAFAGDSPFVRLRAGAIRSTPAAAQWSLMIEIPCSVAGLSPGETFTLALNRTYLRECLQALEIQAHQPAEIRFNNPYTPVLLQRDGASDRFTLLMPMYLDPSDPVDQPTQVMATVG